MTFGLRPEHMTGDGPAAPGDVQVRGRLLLLEPLGAETLGLVRFGNDSDGAEFTGRFPPESPLKAGQDIAVVLKLDHLHLFDPQTGVAVRDAAA